MGGEIVVNSLYPDIQLQENDFTITDMLWPQMEKYSGEIALVCGITNKEYTYDQVMQYSVNFSKGLSKLNIGDDEIIGIVSPMSPKALIAILGFWKAGYAIAPINHLYTREELGRMIDSLSIKTVITTKELVATVTSSGQFENIIVIDHDLEVGEGIHSFEEMALSDQGEVTSTKTRKHKDNIAILSASTGTTGDPKMVAITHRAYWACTKAMAAPDIANAKMLKEGSDRNVVVTVYPLAHVSGSCFSLCFPMYFGFKIICFPKFEPVLYHACFRKYKPTLAMLAPPLVKFLIDFPLFEAQDFEELTTIWIGAAPVPKKYIEDLIKKAHREIVFQEAYGATEVLLSTMVNPSLKNSKVGSVGRLLPNTKAKVIDLDTMESLGPNQIGEIRILTHTVMHSYYNDETATKNAFDENGYYRTGDVGYYDEDGCFYIVDRVRDMIKVKAYQVAPKEIETEILNHPKVDSVCIIGVPHERFGEAPRAYIVRKDESLTEEEIHTFIKDKLAPFKQLAGGIEFIQAIPHIGVGKPLRRELRKQYLEKLASNTSADA